MERNIGRVIDEQSETVSPKTWKEVFAEEIELFKIELNEHLQKGREDEYVMYSGGNEVGVFRSYQEAFTEGRKKYENSRFIVFPIRTNVEGAINHRNYSMPHEKTEEGLQRVG